MSKIPKLAIFTLLLLLVYSSYSQSSIHNQSTQSNFQINHPSFFKGNLLMPQIINFNQPEFELNENLNTRISNINKTFHESQTTKKYRYSIEYVNGCASYEQASNGIQFILGYKIIDKVYGGLGVGYKYHHKQGMFNVAKRSSYPVFLRISADLWTNKSTPYLFSDFGLIIENSLKHNNHKLPFLRLGIGNKLNLKNSMLSLSLNYAYNKSRTIYYAGYDEIIYSNWFKGHAAEVSFGFQFR